MVQDGGIQRDYRKVQIIRSRKALISSIVGRHLLAAYEEQSQIIQHLHKMLCQKNRVYMVTVLCYKKFSLPAGARVAPLRR